VFFQLHRQKRQLAHELQVRTETLRLNEMFSAVLGHDLRSPLQAVTSAAHVIERVAQEPIAQQAATQILNSSRRMTRMIADLLDLSRARLSGGIPVAPQPGDLRPIVERVVEEQQRIHPSRVIQVHVSGDTRAECDPDRIAQALSNLVGNALQHGTPGTPVVVDVAEVPHGVRVTVSNDGTIDQGVMQYVFDPFRAGAERASSSEGLGLGLYIAQQIVCAHGGEITVDVVEARQTAFRIHLPRP
jgi:signal transduction histidine kinase